MHNIFNYTYENEYREEDPASDDEEGFHTSFSLFCLFFFFKENIRRR